MPTYEYRCQSGHTFEVFQRMSDAPLEACVVCGENGVEKVLFAPAVHFKGSGFYSTDYGRGAQKRDERTSADGSGSSADSGGKEGAAKDANGSGGERAKDKDGSKSAAKGEGGSKTGDTGAKASES